VTDESLRSNQAAADLGNVANRVLIELADLVRVLGELGVNRAGYVALRTS
jgi:hypothetical protein